MLRRRIFSSAMASVMALSAVAVVAQAEETTNQVVTEEQLKELVEVTFGADYRADELENYGKNSADAMLDALEAAEAILDDKDADEEDYTVAYQMIMACHGRLNQHSLEELKALLEDCYAELDTNNIFNEELMDQIYKPEKFGALEDAVADAESYLTSTSAGDIADAFDSLENAYKDLLANALPKVSKSDFRNILKQYEAILADEFEYDSWRRGTSAQWYGISSGADWQFTSTHGTAAFGAYYDYCVAKQTEIRNAYDMIDEIKGLTITTDGDILDGYTLACDLVKVYKGWTADSSSRATKSGVKGLLDKYHGQLVHDFNATSVTELLAAIKATEADLTLGAVVGETPVAGVACYGVGKKLDKVTPGYYASNGQCFYLKSGDVTPVNDYWTNISNAVGYEVTEKETVTPDANGKYEAPYDAERIIVTASEITIMKQVAVEEIWNAAGTAVESVNYYYDVTTQAINAGTKAITVDGGKWDTATATINGYQDKGYDRLIKAEFVIKPTNSNLYIPLDANGKWDSDLLIVVDKDQRLDGVKYQTIAKNSKFDLADLIAVDSSMIVDATNGSGKDVKAEFDLKNNATLDNLNEAHPWGKDQVSVYWTDAATPYYVQLADAMAIAEDYLAGDWEDSAIKSIDETGVIAPTKDATGSSKEWVLVYRALEYALTDRYEGVAQGEAYTKADVKDLIEDAYELVEETGDAAIFNLSNVALVKARQEAISWVADAESNKLYKDYEGGKNADGIDYVSSTSAYKTLKGAYDTLNAEYNALKYSFGDVYDALADTAARIDDGELAATDELLAAMDEVAYRLSVMADITTTTGGDYEDNYAFDIDRVFDENNRVVTNSGDAVNIATIAEELEVDKAGVTTKDKANPSHAALLAAFNALNDAIAAQAAPDVLLGDANGDGAVTAADAAAILKSAVGLAEVDAAAADYNGDGAVTAADASAILKALVS